jgi:hypothetical protein
MKKFFSVLAVLFCLVSVSYAQKGVMKFKEETHNFGKIAKDVPVTHKFVFTNTGSEPIIISKVNASCGCTTPSFSKTPVLPGKTGHIEASFNAQAMGVFNKSITVISNGETPTLTLFIKGEVVDKKALPSTK